ncbi:MAG: hypothetical protein PVI41_08165 [Roseobacter sp.]|jgi:hypothetical protein
MKTKALPILALLLLSACATATIVDEQVTEAFVEDGYYGGERYFVRTRTLEGVNGTYEETSVVYRGYTQLCIPTSPNDCESKAERLIEACDDAYFCI